MFLTTKFDQVSGVKWNSLIHWPVSLSTYNVLYSNYKHLFFHLKVYSYDIAMGKTDRERERGLTFPLNSEGINLKFLIFTLFCYLESFSLNMFFLFKNVFKIIYLKIALLF